MRRTNERLAVHEGPVHGVRILGVNELVVHELDQNQIYTWRLMGRGFIVVRALSRVFSLARLVPVRVEVLQILRQVDARLPPVVEVEPL